MPGSNQEFMPGETIGSLMNPFLQGGVEALTGTSLLTGQPKSGKPHNQLQALEQWAGALGGPILRPFTRLPHTQLASSLVDPAEYEGETLYSKSPTEYALSLLGVPIKWVDPDRAAALGKQQQARRR